MSTNDRSEGWYQEHYADPVCEGLTRDSIWTTADKKKVAIRDMTDSHLLNTIRVLRDKSPHGTQWNGPAERRREWLNAMANEAYARDLTIEELTDKEPIHE